MDTQFDKEKKVFFELIPEKKLIGVTGIVIKKKRIIVGRSETSDLVIKRTSISSIHAVIELTVNGARIYDMNSTNGTYINDQKIISEEIKAGTVIKFADVAFTFKEYSEKDLPPPILDMLTSPEIKFEKSSLPELVDDEKIKKPKLEHSIVYPLEKDPKAEYSEYIFEDADELYPIFKYYAHKSSVEVIILYDGKIFSVDYIERKKGKFYLRGVGGDENNPEYPFLGRKEKFPFIKITKHDIFVFTPPNHEELYLSDIKKKTQKNQKDGLILHAQDIIRFHSGKVEIYVRSTDHPPKVDRAPLFRRDNTFKASIVSIMAILICILSFFNIFSVDEELLKEKAPERIATILYNKKLIKPKPEPKPKIKLKPEPPKKKEVAKKVPKKPVQAKKEVVKVKPVKTPEKTKVKVATKTPVKKKVTKLAAKKGAPPKTKVKVAKAIATPSPKKGGKRPISNKRTRFRSKNKVSKGHVDTYKAINFKSTVSSLLSKGGSVAGIKSRAATKSTDIGVTGSAFGGDTAAGSIERSKLNKQVGSLEGSAKGALNVGTSAEGLVTKRGVSIAGIPSPDVIFGSYDPNIIRKILADHIPQFRFCYQKELDRTEAQVSGIIQLNFTIGASGGVVKAGVGKAKKFPGAVRRCVVNVLRGIKFPAPKGGGIVEVKQGMNFYPRG